MDLSILLMIWKSLQVTVQIIKSMDRSTLHHLSPKKKMNKSFDRIKLECDEKCELVDIDNSIKCGSSKRIEMVLEIYAQFIQKENLWNKNSIVNIVNRYSHQRLVDDFLHVHLIHCQFNEKHSSVLRETFKKYTCNPEQCLAFKRHHRDKNENQENERGQFSSNSAALSNKTMEIRYEKDAVFQQE
eukprot:137512_1